MPTGTTGVGGAQYTSVTQSSAQKSNISMQDFLMLIVAQMKSQDMNSTQDNGAFMAQMAQMASMQAMQELTSVFKSSMAINYVGKYVKAEATVAIEEKDPRTGKSTTVGYERVAREGIAQRVAYDQGDTMILIGDVWFKIEDVHEVRNEAPAPSNVGGNTPPPASGNEDEGDNENGSET